MVLIFVKQKIIIKYLREIIEKKIIMFNQKHKEKETDPYKKIFRFEKVVCLTGQSNVYETNKKNINT